MSLQERVAKIIFVGTKPDDETVRMYLLTAQNVCLGAAYFAENDDGTGADWYCPSQYGLDEQYVSEDIARFIAEMPAIELGRLTELGRHALTAA